jgi:outer membrane lipoprotein-sorting protein
MNMRVLILLSISALLAGPALAADVPATVGARMDQSAQSLKTFSADMNQVDHTAIVNDDAKLTGAFRMRKAKPGDTRMLIDYKGADARSISFEGGKLQILYPKINTVQVYQVGDKRALIDQVLLLGFGATVEELKSAYELSWLGQETIAGMASSHLQLIPKSADVLKQIKQVDLWVNESTGLPVQQKFLTSNSGDYKLVTYSNEKQNPSLSEKDLKLNLPKGAVVQNMPR